jgi:hypothetical protein
MTIAVTIQQVTYLSNIHWSLVIRYSLSNLILRQPSELGTLHIHSVGVDPSLRSVIKLRVPLFSGKKSNIWKQVFWFQKLSSSQCPCLYRISVSRQGREKLFSKKNYKEDTQWMRRQGHHVCDNLGTLCESQKRHCMVSRLHTLMLAALLGLLCRHCRVLHAVLRRPRYFENILNRTRSNIEPYSFSRALISGSPRSMHYNKWLNALSSV